MASVIHYRFKTATETNSLRFDGQSLRVFDIKVGKRGRQKVAGTNILSLWRMPVVSAFPPSVILLHVLTTTVCPPHAPCRRPL